MAKRILFSVLALIFMSCTTAIPLTSSLNDFVSMGIKVNSKDAITYKFTSDVQDGLFKPYEKDKSKLVSGNGNYQITPFSTLNRMLDEYITNKFSNLNENSDNVLDIKFKDFWIEQYTNDSGGSQFAAAMFGGEIGFICVAKVNVEVKFLKNGEEIIKKFNATAEDNYVAGIGTGTSTSNTYKGQNSIQYVHAENINKAFNKVIMMLNSFLEEQGL